MSNFPGRGYFFKRKDLLKSKHRGLAISFFIDIIILLLILSRPVALLLSKIEIISIICWELGLGLIVEDKTATKYR